MANRAWSFKAVDQDDLRYFGNTGYDDDSTKYYRFDNFVANHTQVKPGDLVIITDRDSVLGISIIESLPTKPYIKHRNKCPENGCKPEKLTYRKTKELKWRCSNKHVFSTPIIEKVQATEFMANYGEQYKELFGISMATLISKTLRYNVQGSIQEVNLQWANSIFTKESIDVTSEEADSSSVILDQQDQRKSVARQIKQRRGQKSFRDKLISKQAKCSVTDSLIIDILEAAHITPYRNDSHNDISNGLLLRSDIHTLFDLNLFAINPKDLNIHLAPELLNSEYAKYSLLKIDTKHRLNKLALDERWNAFKNAHNFA